MYTMELPVVNMANRRMAPPRTVGPVKALKVCPKFICGVEHRGVLWQIIHPPNEQKYVEMLSLLVRLKLLVLSYANLTMNPKAIS